MVLWLKLEFYLNFGRVFVLLWDQGCSFQNQDHPTGFLVYYNFLRSKQPNGLTLCTVNEVIFAVLPPKRLVIMKSNGLVYIGYVATKLSLLEIFTYDIHIWKCMPLSKVRIYSKITHSLLNKEVWCDVPSSVPWYWVHVAWIDNLKESFGYLF